MKKYLSIITLLAILAVLITSCGSNAAPAAESEESANTAEQTEAEASEGGSEAAAEGADYQWTLVTSVSGLGDQGFNDLSYNGLLQAQETFGGEVNVIESKELGQLVPNLTAAARNGSSLIVGVGFDFVDAITEVAAEYPDVNFAIVDAEVDLDNVASIVFAEQEGSFLGGVMAGLMTESNVVGFIGGQEFPPVLRWQAGYMAGVKAANPDAEILVTYAGTFADPVKGREAALAIYNNGADIIFESAGGTALGIYEVVQEIDGTNWVFGPDVCKHQLAPDNTLPNVTKNVDVALLKIAEEIVNGEFKGGSYSLGLADNGMGMCQEKYEELLPADVIAKIETARKMIVSGEVVVPTAPEDVESFVAPDL